MAAGVLNLALEQGATFRKQVTWRQPAVAPATQGPPNNLSGCTAHMQIRPKVGGEVLLDLADGAGITLGGAAGTIEIAMTAVQTGALLVKRAVYDLYIAFPSGDRTRLLEGKVTIDPTVTVTS